MTAPRESRLVTVFDASLMTNLFGDMAVKAAQEAGWDPRAFEKEYDAIQSLNNRTAALIAAPQDQLSVPYYGEALLRTAAELEVPRAVISWLDSHPLVRPGGPDLFIPKNDIRTVKPRLVEWLLSLE